MLLLGQIVIKQARVKSSKSTVDINKYFKIPETNEYTLTLSMIQTKLHDSIEENLAKH